MPGPEWPELVDMASLPPEKPVTGEACNAQGPWASGSVCRWKGDCHCRILVFLRADQDILPEHASSPFYCSSQSSVTWNLSVKPLPSECA